MKIIVSLVDLTGDDTAILDLTLHLASALGSTVVLLHVIPPDTSHDAAISALGVTTPQFVDVSDIDRGTDVAKLNEALTSVIERGVAATALQFEGDIADTVLKKLETLNADLVIMGTHHHSALYNLFIGSVTADILGRAPCPVLVVPHAPEGELLQSSLPA